MKPIRRAGRTYLVQNERYQKFSQEFDACIMQKKDKKPTQAISCPCNVQIVIGRSDHRRTDLVNNLNAVLDKLVDNDILKDDNYTIVHSMDGSYMEYSKNDYIYIKITKIEP